MVDSRLTELQLIICRPLLLFDHYASMPAVEHVVDAAREKGDARGERLSIVLRHVRPGADQWSSLA